VPVLPWGHTRPKRVNYLVPGKILEGLCSLNSIGHWTSDTWHHRSQILASSFYYWNSSAWSPACLIPTPCSYSSSCYAQCLLFVFPPKLTEFLFSRTQTCARLVCRLHLFFQLNTKTWLGKIGKQNSDKSVKSCNFSRWLTFLIWKLGRIIRVVVYSATCSSCNSNHITVVDDLFNSPFLRLEHILFEGMSLQF
jgi:hypothetical protein